MSITKPDMTLNTVSLLQEGLQKKVKSALTESLVKEPLEQFDAIAKELREHYEERIREKIKTEVELISFRTITSLAHCIKMREELHVFLHHEGEVKSIVITPTTV